MNEKEYKDKFGHEPIQDDLERVNCKDIGIVGHSQCGVCEKHNKPRFACGCLAPSTNLKELNEKTFSVPVTYTVSGWIEIKAETLAQAKQKAEKLNEEGVEMNQIEDSETSSEVHIEEMEER